MVELTSKKWWVDQQKMVSWPAKNGELTNKKWWVDQQEMVSWPARNGELPARNDDIFRIKKEKGGGHHFKPPIHRLVKWIWLGVRGPKTIGFGL